MGKRTKGIERLRIRVWGKSSGLDSLSGHQPSSRAEN